MCVDKVKAFPVVFECNPLLNEYCVSKLCKLTYCSVVLFIELYLVALAALIYLILEMICMVFKFWTLRGAKRLTCKLILLPV